MRSPIALLLGAVSLAGVAVCVPSVSSAQVATSAAATPLPFDPGVTVGTLSNGMRYYIRENHKPEKRAELRLVVNAGSVLEDEDQRGLAHMLEHMAFRGTKKFPLNQVSSYLESVGMRYGPDINAFTSFDQTTYQLAFPDTKPETLDWEKSNWYTTPTASFADYTALSQLPKVKLKVASRSERKGDESITHVTLENPSSALAFFVRLKVNKGTKGEEILPVIWQDNYVSLLPGEKREITASYRSSALAAAKPVVEVSGWNVQ